MNAKTGQAPTEIDVYEVDTPEHPFRLDEYSDRLELLSDGKDAIYRHFNNFGGDQYDTGIEAVRLMNDVFGLEIGEHSWIYDLVVCATSSAAHDQIDRIAGILGIEPDVAHWVVDEDKSAKKDRNLPEFKGIREAFERWISACDRENP